MILNIKNMVLIVIMLKLMKILDAVSSCGVCHPSEEEAAEARRENDHEIF